MRKKLKVVTIGGGSSYTPELLEGFIKRYDELPITELWLVDVEAGKEKQNIIFNLCQRMVERAGVPIVMHKTLDRREALVDADFVTTQLRVGQLKARELDERVRAGGDLRGRLRIRHRSRARTCRLRRKRLRPLAVVTRRVGDDADGDRDRDSGGDDRRQDAHLAPGALLVRH